MNPMKFFIALITFLFIYILPVEASDLSREKRMAEQIVDAIMDGDAVYLQGDGNKFLSIYTQADTAKGTAIILHGRGFPPDWQDAINPLRVGLVGSGWNTLSIQMPVLEKQAKYYDYVPLFPEALPRIDAAIKYARKHAHSHADGKTSEKVVLIAHSCGSHMAMAWVSAMVDVQHAGKGLQNIDAYVGISMGATDYQQLMSEPFPLDKLTMPVLDVYAENDYPAVLSNAPGRLSMIKSAGNEKSDQVMVADADHYYESRGDALTRVVSLWLDTL